MKTEIETILAKHGAVFPNGPYSNNNKTGTKVYSDWSKVRENLVSLLRKIKQIFDEEDIVVSGKDCVGSGGAAKVPWVACRINGGDNPRAMKTTQGLYVNYIFWRWNRMFPCVGFGDQFS